MGCQLARQSSSLDETHITNRVYGAYAALDINHDQRVDWKQLQVALPLELTEKLSERFTDIPDQKISFADFKELLSTLGHTDFLQVLEALELHRAPVHEQEVKEMATEAERIAAALESELQERTQELNKLQAQLHEQRKYEIQTETHFKPDVRIFMEGAFDLMHYGHMNAFRLGRSLGTHLVVGVNSSATIRDCKGTAPVMTDDERLAAVRGCRFVDEVVERTPYVMTPEYLAEIMEEYSIDFVVHGDDPCLVNGEDVYGHVKTIGKYKSIPRTEGISTTDIVGRMLLCSTEHHQHLEIDLPDSTFNQHSPETTISSGALNFQRGQFSSKFMTTSQVLRGFSVGMKPPPASARVVYMGGAWDMFHAGHVEILQQARKLGDYLIVGVLSDKLVNQFRGANFPIMNLNERVLSVMGCRFVSDVLIDAPYEVDQDMIASLNISVVAHATDYEDAYYCSTEDPFAYVVPRELGMFTEITSKNTLQVTDILERLQKNREQFEQKFADKIRKEKAFWRSKYDNQNQSQRGVTTSECDFPAKGSD